MISFEVEQDLLPLELRWTPERLQVLTTILAEELPGVAGEVQVAIVNEADIRRYNRQYRGKDKVTDVLSFGVESAVPTGQLGDVLICFEQAQRQAADGDLELELTDLLVHGILHLLGHDHELPAEAEVMFPLQDRIVGRLL